MAKKTFYITTAIFYPNAKPHIGHAYEQVVADAIARWHRLKGEDVFFLTGTDEHGQKIYKTAKDNGKEPQQWVDEMLPFFTDLCKKLNISYSRFIRTTEKEHKKVCQEIFKKLDAKGDIYKDSYEGLYCTGCERFYTDKELDEGVCPIHKKKPELLKEETYFFKMSKYQDKLLKHIKDNPDFIQPESRRNEILNRLKEPLRDLSVSRPVASLPWGVPVPGDKEHVLYVWLDALLNYISGVDYPGANFKKYWPANVHIIGKDILWFHTVIWPCELMSAGIKLPKTVHAHGFVNLGGEKLSKSRGIVVDPVKLVKEYGTDPVRYFFIKEIPAGEDGNFSYEALVERSNSDLADVLGNLLQRTTVLTHKNFEGKIPKPGKFEKIDTDLIKESDIFKEVDALMLKYEWNKAVDKIWGFIRACNKYINDTEPWKLKEDKERLGTIIYTLVECLRIISIYASPIIPATAEKIAKQIGQKPGTFADIGFRKTTKGKVSKSEILFQKFEIKEEDPFSKVNLKVAEITEVKDHPDADKLFVMQISLGKEKRQVVAGLKPYFKPEELRGKHVVIMTNLKASKLRGVESNGMVIAAEQKKKVVLLEAPKSKPGDQVFIEGIEPGEEQITVKQFQQAQMTTKNKTVIYKKQPLKTKKEEIKADIDDNAKVL
ncbi:methionine--tRNA ligase [Candidatus Woesearchaeota archaeon]|nr:methionine--tRNA ligase [Candidatus Woesearchaeota archaeon]MBW2994324.1 methionine--tRNA ligase [Candidatus Woesearchaeota archaeon]